MCICLCAAHLLVFCLVLLLCRPTLGALVRLLPRGTDLGCSWHVCVTLCTHRASGLASLGGGTVHLQTPQLAALEAALVHDATRPPCVWAIARFTCWCEHKSVKQLLAEAMCSYLNLLYTLNNIQG